MVDCKYLDILQAFDPSKFITDEYNGDQEKEIGSYCSIFPQKMDDIESFIVDEKQTVMVCMNRLSGSEEEAIRYQIQRRLLPKYQLVNSSPFPEMFNPKLFWMSHDSRKLVLVTQEINSEFELRVYDTLTCFKAFTQYDENEGKDILLQAPFLLSIKIDSSSQVSNAFMSKDYTKLIVQLDQNKQPISNEIQSKYSSLLMIFDIKDALNKTISLSHDKLIDIQKEQDSVKSQQFTQDGIHILNFNTAFDFGFQQALDNKNKLILDFHHYTVQSNQDTASHKFILSFKSSQTYNPNLMIVDFNNPLDNVIVALLNFDQNQDDIQIKDDFIVHVKYDDNKNISQLIGYQYDGENKTLSSQFTFHPLIEKASTIQIVNIEKDKHITYLISSLVKEGDELKEKQNQYLIQHSFQNLIYIYQDVSQFLNTTKPDIWGNQENHRFEPDYFKLFNITSAYMNPYYPKYIVYYFTNGAFAIAKHQERRSIFRTWSSEKDQGFSIEQLEYEARFAFDDIVQNKVKLIKRLEPITFMMVRDIASASNSENKCEVERWLGFYRNGIFYNLIRFENYTLKNIPLIHYQYRQSRILSDISLIEFYLYNENELRYNSVTDKLFKKQAHEIEDILIITLNKNEKIKYVRINKKIGNFDYDNQASLKKIDTNTLITFVINSEDFDQFYTNYEHFKVSTEQILSHYNDVYYSKNSYNRVILKKQKQSNDCEINYIHQSIKYKLKLRTDQQFDVKLISVFDNYVLIQSLDNRLFLFRTGSLYEIMLPAQFKSREFKIKSKFDCKLLRKFKLIFNECETCLVEADNNCYDCVNRNRKRYSILKVIVDSFEANKGTSKGSFLFEGFIPEYSYFKYCDAENNRYDFYDSRTNIKISSVETIFCQAEARFLKALSITPNRKILNLLKRNQPLIRQLLKCHGNLGNLIDVVNLKETVLESLQEEFQLFQKCDIPLIFIELKCKPSSLGQAIRSDAKRCVKLLLDIFLEFQDNFVTGLTIDKNLRQLIKNNYDVKELLEKDILLIKLDDIQESSQFVKSNKIEYFTCYQKENPETKFSNIQEFNQYSFGTVQSRENLYPCEFRLTCLKSTFERIDLFFDALKNHNNLEIYENEVIQLIIDYYWSDRVILQLKRNFMVYLVFLTLLVFNVLDSVFNKSTDENQNVTDNRIGWLVTCQTLIICIFNTLYLTRWAKLFFRQVKYNYQIKWYKNKEMNLNFLFYSIIYPIVILNDSSEHQEGLLIYQILMLVFGFYQLNFHLQIYEGFSFMISMFYEAFIDLKYFVAFFVLIIVEFALLFLLAFKGQSKEQYEGLSIFGGYMMMAFRLSTGDFELDTFKDQNNFFILIAWGIWIVSVLALNMIFLNFIIAVISGTFDKVMQNQVSQQYKKKVELFTNTDQVWGCFIIRKPLEVSGEQQSWNGFVKDVKRSVQSNSQKTQKNMDFKLNECNELMSSSYIDIQNLYSKESNIILNEIEEIQKLLSQL
eukprot:403367315